MIDASQSGSGAVVCVHDRTTPDVVKSHIVRTSDRARIATHPNNLDMTDEAGKLGIVNSGGVQLFRIGEDRPLVTFDLDRPLVGGACHISPDGRFVYWGRRNGTVCVADVNRCLEQLAPFGKR